MLAMTSLVIGISLIGNIDPNSVPNINSLMIGHQLLLYIKSTIGHFW